MLLTDIITASDIKAILDAFEQDDDYELMTTNELNFISSLKTTKDLDASGLLEKLLVWTLNDEQEKATDYCVLDLLGFILDDEIAKTHYRDLFYAFKKLHAAQLLNGVDAQKHFNSLMQEKGKNALRRAKALILSNETKMLNGVVQNTIAENAVPYALAKAQALNLLNEAKMSQGVNAYAYNHAIDQSNGQYAVEIAKTLCFLKLNYATLLNGTHFRHTLNTIIQNGGELAASIDNIMRTLQNAQLLDENNAQAYFVKMTQDEGRFVKDIALIVGVMQFRQILNHYYWSKLISYVEQAQKNNHGIRFLAEKLSDFFLTADPHDNILFLIPAKSPNKIALDENVDHQAAAFLETLELPLSLLEQKANSVNSNHSKNIALQIMCFYEHIYDNLPEEVCGSFQEYQEKRNPILTRLKDYLSMAIKMPLFLQSILELLNKQIKSKRLETLDIVLTFLKNPQESDNDVHYKNTELALLKLAGTLRKTRIENAQELLTLKHYLEEKTTFKNQFPQLASERPPLPFFSQANNNRMKKNSALLQSSLSGTSRKFPLKKIGFQSS